MKMKTTYHRDGTVTYWSVYDQAWRRHQRTIQDQELAAMSPKERDRVMRHMGIEI